MPVYAGDFRAGERLNAQGFEVLAVGHCDDQMSWQ